MKLLSIFLTFIALVAALFYYKHEPAPRYYLSACAIFRNEARFLREWIEYHNMIGIEHFYLFNNLSDDDYQTVLQPYIEKGLVELIQWPYEGKNQKEWNLIQCDAYNTLIKQKQSETFWLAVIDTDEFILPLTTPNLAEFLHEYEEWGGLAINWQLYGASGVQRVADNQTLIGSLTKKAQEQFEINHFVKSIVQPKKVLRFKYPHHCKYKKPFFHVTENKIRFSNNSLTESVSINKIRLNHYTHRDRDFFEQEKKPRLLKWHPGNTTSADDPQLNAIEDRAILPLVPILEDRLFAKIKQ